MCPPRVVDMQLRKLLFLALALALVSEQTVRCQGYGEEEDEPYGEGAYGGGGGGGYGGDEGMPPPPPPEETQELLTLDDFEAFVDNTDASVIAAFTDKEIIDPKAVMPEGVCLAFTAALKGILDMCVRPGLQVGISRRMESGRRP